jgi:hypothetical protein
MGMIDRMADTMAKSSLERISLECGECRGRACQAKWRSNRENMLTTSMGMAPNTQHLLKERTSAVEQSNRRAKQVGK